MAPTAMAAINASRALWVMRKSSANVKPEIVMTDGKERSNSPAITRKVKPNAKIATNEMVDPKEIRCPYELMLQTGASGNSHKICAKPLKVYFTFYRGFWVSETAICSDSKHLQVCLDTNPKLWPFRCQSDSVP